MIGKIRILIAIEDEIYLDRLCDFLETCHGRFATKRFSNKNALAEVLRTRKDFDVILYEPDMIDNKLADTIQKVKIKFGQKEILDSANGCYTIREFQKTDNIANTVLNICSTDIRFMGIESGTPAKKAQLTVFASPVGGVGVTTVSLGTAIQLARSGKRTLYINLEQISSLSTLLPVNGISMTQVMRMAIEHNPKLLTAVDGGKSIEPISGLHYFGGFKDLTDFDSLEPEHMYNLALQLCELGMYDFIIADVTWNTRLITPLFNSAGKIFLVSRNTDLSVQRVNAFLQFANDMEASYRHRVHIVLNAQQGGVNRELIEEPIVSVPRTQMVIDTAGFASAALGNSECQTFADALVELAGRLSI